MKMPDVATGITTEGQAGHDELALPTHPGAQPIPDPGLDAPLDIQRGVLDREQSRDVADGLSVTLPPAAELPDEPLPDHLQAMVDEAGRQQEQDARDLEAGREAMSELRMREFLEDVEAAEGAPELAAALANLRPHISADEYESVLYEAAAYHYGIDPQDATPEMLEEFAEFVNNLDGNVSNIDLLKIVLEKDRLAQDLLPKVAAERSEAVLEEAREFARDVGIRSQGEFNARFAVLQDFAKNAMGFDLEKMVSDPNGFDRKAFHDVLRTADAALAEHATQERTRALHQGMLDDELTSSVQAGLGPYSPFDWEVGKPQGERQLPPPRPDSSRIAARARRYRESVADIQFGVADSPSLMDGLTAGDGKPLTPDKATSADVRYRREQEEAAQQMASIFGGRVSTHGGQ
jgi:hypothetical protein